ncbi:MAG: tetrahydromethanopterin S-methyltransferase subunit A [Candidatus Bathyarchaeia archaeon]|nr:tetrahydromethanopterin S-methyltransferase subunit A [Candidatus Bathyarchaeota archaeon]
MIQSRKILKVKPPDEYPPEDGNYLRGNDYSPVAVVILLHTPYDKIPDFLLELSKVSVEAGAALAGFLQTENIGIEKIVCNVVANPNIRYIILCGVESAGHRPGQTFEAFIKNGIDDKRKIVGAESLTPYLYNISLEAIERFRKQVTLVSLLFEENRRLRIDPETVKSVVNACIQEESTPILNFNLYDPGAYPEPAICQKITWRVERPWAKYSEEEAEKMRKIEEAASIRSKLETERQRRRREEMELLELLFPNKTKKE